MENSNKNKDCCEKCKSLNSPLIVVRGGGVYVCNNETCPDCHTSPLIPKSEEKKCVECENGEKHGDCTKCGLQTTPIMRCKCPERQSDGSWEVKPSNGEESLKEEFLNKAFDPKEGFEDINGQAAYHEIADWWLAKLSHSKTLILEEVEKKLLKESWQEDAGNEVVRVEDIKTIIKLIKEDK